MTDINKNQYQFASSAGFAIDVATDNQPTRKVSVIPYSGGVITNHGYWEKVIFDLSTVKFQDETPLLFNHEADKVIGRVNLSVQNGQVVGDGVLYSGIDDDAQSIAAKADAGHKWQMSIWISPERVEEVYDTPVMVNGIPFANGIIFRAGLIRECSILSMGADSNTSATIFNFGKKDSNMEKTEANNQELEQALAKIALLEAESAAKDAQLAQFSASIAEKRVEDVKQLFSAIGLEHSDEAAKPYLSMNSQQFSSVSANMLAVKATQQARPAHLFSNTTMISTTETHTGTGLVAAAKQRNGE